MCNWRKWVLPGILATAILTALAMLFHAGSIENDLAEKATMALQPEHDWAEIKLDGRELTLSGVAPSPEAQSDALTLAANAYHVRTVGDETTLPSLQAPFVFEAQKRASGIVLSGFAPTQADVDALVGATTAANADTTVTKELQIARGAPDGFIELATFGVTQLGALSDGSMKTENQEFSIAGSAATPEDYAAVREQLTGVLPGGGVLASSDINAPIVSPYIWSATRSNSGAVTVSGFAPDEETSRAIVDAATLASGTGQVVDTMQIAAGAPQNFVEATQLGLDAIGTMTTGEAIIDAQSLQVEGETFGRAARNQLSERLAQASFEGFQIEQRLAISPGPLAPGGSGPLEPEKCQARLAEILATDTIRFATGNAEIEMASFPLLDQLAYVARACPQTQLEVGGHTDSDGDEDANQQLSLQRAVSVVNYLIVGRVSSARLTAVGYGETSPVASNDTDEGKAQNRRIEFTIIQ